MKSEDRWDETVRQIDALIKELQSIKHDFIQFLPDTYKNKNAIKNNSGNWCVHLQKNYKKPFRYLTVTVPEGAIYRFPSYFLYGKTTITLNDKVKEFILDEVE